jgi:hypothetical protein
MLILYRIEVAGSSKTIDKHNKLVNRIFKDKWSII